MKKINILTLIIIILCSISLPVHADSAIISINLLNQDPDPAIAGEITEIRFGVENRGTTEAQDVVIEFDTEYPFTLIPGEEAVQDLGTLTTYRDGSDIKIIKYKIIPDKDAIAGEYELRLLQYTEGNRESAYIEKTFNIDVKNKESAEIIYIDKVELLPGKQTPMKFTIHNVGSAPLRDLTFSWENEDDVILPVGSADTKYVKYIEVGDKAELTYNVIADSNADPGLYKLGLNLVYEDPITGEEKEINNNAGVYVGGSTDFDIAFSESSSSQTSFTIANIGSTPATSVSVIIPEQDGWKVTGSNSMIIGNLNTGDYTVASFGLQQSSGMTRQGEPTQRKNITQSMKKTDSLKIQIAYTNTMGKREIIEKEITMSMQNLIGSTTETGTTSEEGMPQFRRMNQQSFISKYKWYFIIALVLAVGVVFLRYRKKKLENPKLTLKEFFNINSKKKK